MTLPGEAVTVDPVDSTASAASADIQGRSLSQIAFGRLKRDKVAVGAFITIVLIMLAAIFAPLICKLFDVDPFTFHTELLSDDGGLPLGKFGGVSMDHPLGVEPLTGRDILARLLYGARVSLLVAVLTTSLTVMFGLLIGTIAGYSKGWLDTALGRLMDLVLSFPVLLVTIAMVPVIQQRLSKFLPEGNPSQIAALILLLSIFGWPYLARLVRGQVISLREREFVEAAVSTGASTRRILFKELIPNLWAPVLVYATIALPGFIAAEASLSYLGIGVLPPTPTWGGMLADSVKFFTVDPAYLFIPGTMLFITVLSFNLLGDAVRDALDPRAGRS